jgi:NAD+ kinase
MHAPFKRVVIYARHHRANQGVNETLLRLVDFLEKKKVSAFLDIDTALHFSIDLPTLPREAMTPDDLIVVIGGDGSLLSAANMAIKKKVPVIGVNRGRLGFLTDISPAHLDQELGAVLDGHYQEEQRFLLNLRLNENKHIVSTALNDIVLNRGHETHLITFDVYVDTQCVSQYRADGLIIATPTGSTAYALSAGGPILHPKLNAIVIVPMFSHSLSARPLVIDANSTIDIKISDRNEHTVEVSCDGHESYEIEPGQSITINKHAIPLRLLHPQAYYYYDTLRLKLGWGSKPVN